MRKLLVLLAVTRVAQAQPVLEFGAGIAARPPEQTRALGCDLQLELRGAVVDAWLTERLQNTAPVPLGAVDELALPVGAQLLEARVGADRSVGVPVAFSREPASDAVAADPAFVTALQPDAGHRPRYRIVASPIEPGHDLALALHWTALAELHRGALHVTLPGRPCHAQVHVSPLAGATVAAIEVAGRETRGAFEIADRDTELAVKLAYTRPLTWTQTEALGGGYVARATTLAAPPARAPGARRVLLLVDGSRSMKLVGDPAVSAVVRAIGAALPEHAELDAVIFDRAPVRVLGAWQPADAATLDRIVDAIHTHAPGNGSDAAAALGLAHNLLADTRGEPMIVMITDAAFGALDGDALTRALSSGELAVDLHAIVLDRGRLAAQSEEPLRRAIARVGGSYVEVDADALDGALADVDTWLRPSTTIAGHTLLAGTGVTELEIVRGGRAGASAPIAQLALAMQTATAIAGDEATPAVVERAEQLLARLRRGHPAADANHALAVLASRGGVARARREAVAGGGPYVRTTDVSDPVFAPEIHTGTPIVVASAIDRGILERLFQLELQPKAYVCYQRALGSNRALAGTVTFHLEIGRGEVTRATVDGLHDAAFDACLLDAAYAIAPAMPDPSYHTDDRTLASYPLTFSVHEQHPLVIPGDADSSTPLDIDAIEGGPPPRHIEAGDTKNPLGGLRP